MNEIKNYNDIKKEISVFSKNVRVVFVVKKQKFRSILDFLKEFYEHHEMNILLGENYVNEAKALQNYLRRNLDEKIFDSLEWHLIGPLQNSNINKALKIFDVIQAVNSYEKAFEINKRAERLFSGRKLVDVYLQVNIGREDNKSGIEPEFDLIKAECLKISELEHVNLRGLMCIEPFFEENREENSREYFRKMKEFFDRLNEAEGIDLDILSMGMTDTYKSAVKEGSNMVRIGRKIFGERAGNIFTRKKNME